MAYGLRARTREPDPTGAASCWGAFGVVAWQWRRGGVCARPPPTGWLVSNLRVGQAPPYQRIVRGGASPTRALLTPVYSTASASGRSRRSQAQARPVRQVIVPSFSGVLAVQVEYGRVQSWYSWGARVDVVDYSAGRRFDRPAMGSAASSLSKVVARS